MVAGKFGVIFHDGMTNIFNFSSSLDCFGLFVRCLRSRHSMGRDWIERLALTISFIGRSGSKGLEMRGDLIVD